MAEHIHKVWANQPHFYYRPTILTGGINPSGFYNSTDLPSQHQLNIDNLDGQGRFLQGKWNNTSDIPLLSTDRVSATGVDAVKTYAALGGACHEVHGVAWGYSATPTNGGLRIEDGVGNIVREFPITSAGYDSYDFDPPVRNRSQNTALIVTLRGGGGIISGTLNIEHKLA